MIVIIIGLSILFTLLVSNHPFSQFVLYIVFDLISIKFSGDVFSNLGTYTIRVISPNLFKVFGIAKLYFFLVL